MWDYGQVERRFRNTNVEETFEIVSNICYHAMQNRIIESAYLLMKFNNLYTCRYLGFGSPVVSGESTLGGLRLIAIYTQKYVYI